LGTEKQKQLACGCAGCQNYNRQILLMDEKTARKSEAAPTRVLLPQWLNNGEMYHDLAQPRPRYAVLRGVQNNKED